MKKLSPPPQAADESHRERKWREDIIRSSGTVSALTDKPFVTIGNDVDLTKERALVGSANINVQDNGPNASVALDLINTSVAPGTYAAPLITVDAKGRITASSTLLNGDANSYLNGIGSMATIDLSQYATLDELSWRIPYEDFDSTQWRENQIPFFNNAGQLRCLGAPSFNKDLAWDDQVGLKTVQFWAQSAPSYPSIPVSFSATRLAGGGGWPAGTYTFYCYSAKTLTYNNFVQSQNNFRSSTVTLSLYDRVQLDFVLPANADSAIIHVKVGNYYYYKVFTSSPAIVADGNIEGWDAVRLGDTRAIFTGGNPAWVNGNQAQFKEVTAAKFLLNSSLPGDPPLELTYAPSGIQGTGPTGSAFNLVSTDATSYAVGDLLTASSTSTVSRLADVATGAALISGGVGVAPTWGKIAEQHLALSDITTNNASTTQHGFLPKLSNVAANYLNGLGNWVTPELSACTWTDDLTLTVASKAIIFNSGAILKSNGGAHYGFISVYGTGYWLDGVGAQFFQVGDSNANLAFTAGAGTLANRLAFVTKCFQTGDTTIDLFPVPAADLIAAHYNATNGNYAVAWYKTYADTNVDWVKFPMQNTRITAASDSYQGGDYIRQLAPNMNLGENAYYQNVMSAFSSAGSPYYNCAIRYRATGGMYGYINPVMGFCVQAPSTYLLTSMREVMTLNGDANLSLGIAGTVGGSLSLQGGTSGYCKLQPTAAAGNVTITLPPAGGTVALQGLAGTKVYYVSDSSGGAVTRKLTFTNGILTSET